MLVYIVIVCIVFLALRDFGGRRFISTVLLLLLFNVEPRRIFGSNNFSHKIAVTFEFFYLYS